MLLEEKTYFGEGNRYYLEKRLGRGGFSEVWLVKDSITELELALKVYAPGTGMDEDGLKTFSKELAVVYDLNHSNLLKPQHVDSWQGMPYLVMSFCPNGSLVKRIGKMTEDEIWKVLHDVASGLAYLHERDIVHQDIKPDNILVDNIGNYVITDFGISAKARTTLRKSVAAASANSGGTIAYMGPERFGKEPAPIKASDIWSLGAMLFELMTGDTPFGEHGGLVQKSGAEIPTIKGDYSDELKQLVEKMLSPEPWDRPTASQLMEGKTIGTHEGREKKISHKQIKHMNRRFVLWAVMVLTILGLVVASVFIYQHATRLTIEKVDKWIADGTIGVEIDSIGPNAIGKPDSLCYRCVVKGIPEGSLMIGDKFESCDSIRMLPEEKYEVPQPGLTWNFDGMVSVRSTDSVSVSILACIKTDEGCIERVIGLRSFNSRKTREDGRVNDVPYVTLGDIRIYYNDEYLYPWKNKDDNTFFEKSELFDYRGALQNKAFSGDRQDRADFVLICREIKKDIDMHKLYIHFLNINKERKSIENSQLREADFFIDTNYNDGLRCYTRCFAIRGKLYYCLITCGGTCRTPLSAMEKIKRDVWFEDTVDGKVYKL